MPKIAAASIEEHVRRQTTRILDAAGEIFARDGYRGTDLAGIADRTGLARNSLYRYFPSKDHILLAVMQRDMAPFIERANLLAVEYPDPAARIDAWLDMQLELATGPCHAMIRMLGDLGEASDDMREQIRDLHLPMRSVLEGCIADLLEGADRNPEVIGAMIASMVQSAAGIAMRTGNVQTVGTELKRAVKRILSPGE
ncbi:MAG: TetR/AcrR family transcriptional regulator [Gammaproteobacteria bacterium]